MQLRSIYTIKQSEFKELLNKGDSLNSYYVLAQHPDAQYKGIEFSEHNLVHDDASCISHLILGYLQLTATDESYCVFS